MAGFYGVIARFYDAENKGKDDDINLYLEQASESGGPILDVGCGTGRVMVPLAEAGHQVHGVDNEPAMLALAERYREQSPTLTANMTLHEGDALTIALPAAYYRLILVPYNGLMHFHTQDDQLALLHRLREWITPDGLLILDLPNAGEVFATQETDAIMFERTFLEPETGHMVLQQSHSVLDRVTQMLDVTWIYDEILGDGTIRRTVALHRLYYLFFSELRLLLQMAGFAVQAVYGDTDYAPYEDGCERMVVFARPVAQD